MGLPEFQLDSMDEVQSQDRAYSPKFPDEIASEKLNNES
jgi:hypothetical protein